MTALFSTRMAARSLWIMDITAAGEVAGRMIDSADQQITRDTDINE
jgi:hypothetical protein